MARLRTMQGMPQEAAVDWTDTSFWTSAGFNEYVGGVKINLEDIATMQHGEWMNDSMANMLAYAAYAWLNASPDMLFMDSLILGIVDRGQLSRLARVEERVVSTGIPTAIGLLNMRNRHWVAYRIDYTVESGPLSRGVRVEGDTVGIVTMRVFDSLFPSNFVNGALDSVRLQGSLRWDAGDLIRKKRFSYQYQSGPGGGVGGKSVYEKALRWFCGVGVKKMPAQQQYRAEMLVYGTGQQSDGWSCARWAVANLVSLIMQGRDPSNTIKLASSFASVERCLMQTADVLLRGVHMPPDTHPIKLRRRETIIIDLTADSDGDGGDSDGSTGTACEGLIDLASD